MLNKQQARQDSVVSINNAQDCEVAPKIEAPEDLRYSVAIEIENEQIVTANESINAARRKVDEAAAICRSEYCAGSQEEQAVFLQSYEKSREDLVAAQLAGTKVLDEIIEYGNEKSAEIPNTRLHEFVEAAEVLRFQNTVEEVIKAREAIEVAASFVDFHVAFHRMNAGFSAAIDAMPNQEAGYYNCLPVLEAVRDDLFVFANMHDRQTECEEQARVKAKNEAKELEAIQAVLDQFELEIPACRSLELSKEAPIA
jgi:hypothetical protein